VKVSGDKTAKVSDGEYGQIECSFPNGVQVNCLVGIDIPGKDNFGSGFNCNVLSVNKLLQFGRNNPICK
jgi:hypothetical protein